jgi:hypothetical protein
MNASRAMTQGEAVYQEPEDLGDLDHRGNVKSLRPTNREGHAADLVLTSIISRQHFASTELRPKNHRDRGHALLRGGELALKPRCHRSFLFRWQVKKSLRMVGSSLPSTSFRYWPLSSGQGCWYCLLSVSVARSQCHICATKVHEAHCTML